MKQKTLGIGSVSKTRRESSEWAHLEHPINKRPWNFNTKFNSLILLQNSARARRFDCEWRGYPQFFSRFLYLESIERIPLFYIHGKIYAEYVKHKPRIKGASISLILHQTLNHISNKYSVVPQCHKEVIKEIQTPNLSLAYISISADWISPYFRNKRLTLPAKGNIPLFYWINSRTSRKNELKGFFFLPQKCILLTNSRASDSTSLSEYAGMIESHDIKLKCRSGNWSNNFKATLPSHMQMKIHKWASNKQSQSEPKWNHPAMNLNSFHIKPSTPTSSYHIRKCRAKRSVSLTNHFDILLEIWWREGCKNR